MNLDQSIVKFTCPQKSVKLLLHLEEDSLFFKLLTDTILVAYFVYSPHMGMGITRLAFFPIFLTIVLPASLDHMRLDICVAFP